MDAGVAAAPAARHYLLPGQRFVTREPHEITTVLGTCVAVCLWDARTGAGGINHYLLPNRIEGDGSWRFGGNAVPGLIEEVRAIVGPRANLSAKVFGGMVARSAAVGRQDLGTANAKLALEVLASAGIPVLACDVGGPRGRKLVFRLPSSEVLIKYL